MVDVTANDTPLTDESDGIPLKVKLARATRRQKIKALMLVAPLFLFVAITFIYPIALMLVRSTYDPLVGQLMHRTAAVIQDWNGEGLPAEPVWEAFVLDLQETAADKEIGKVALRFNFDLPGTRSLFMASGRKAKRLDVSEITSFREYLVGLDKKWENPEVWGSVAC